MTTHHDQLMKELIAAFPRQLLRLAVPEIAERLNLATVAFEPEEHYPGTPAGRARRPDLVSRAGAKAGAGEDEVLLHVEIELRFQSQRLPGLLSYQRGLSLKYALPVHTIVLYLRGGQPGAQIRSRSTRKSPWARSSAPSAITASGCRGCRRRSTWPGPSPWLGHSRR